MANILSPSQTTRRSIAFLNWAHAIDHFVLLIYPTVVIGLEAVYHRPYSELIALSTASFVAFGVFSLPAGWLADRWSRRNMMAAFYLGCAVSLVGAAMAPNLLLLATALFFLGVFAAIYHPVGMAMLIEASQARGRTLAFNGVCGNLGVALAAGITATLIAWIGWRAAFMIPGLLCAVTGIFYLLSVPDDHRHGMKRESRAKVPLSSRAMVVMLAIYLVISVTGGLTFNTILITVPKIVDERVGDSVPLVLVGGIATCVFICGAIGQVIVGRIVEKIAPALLFVIVVALQVLGCLWAATTTGLPLVIGLAVTMAGIYGQVTTGDIVLARYTADAWRGRVYAVRYFVTFVSAGLAVQVIKILYSRGGFDLVLWSMVGITAILLVAVIAFAVLVLSVETHQRAVTAPAE
ncbi:MAG TPA: MFS transporter [Pseudolabrys sp.]|nr:MFS transporter [Pseudolabrys sp.]